MPPGVANRSREIWEPLLAIADAAGGHWSTTARNACAHFVREAEQAPVTTGVRLLADLRTVFADRNTDRLATVDILAALADLDEAPWGDINGPGRPLDARRLARELALYHVAPGPFRNGGQIAKGYVTHATKTQVGLCRRMEPIPGRRPGQRRRGGIVGALNTARELLTVAAFCAEMQISRSTFYEWIAKGKAPRCRKLPNGQLRIDRRDIDAWFESCQEAA